MLQVREGTLAPPDQAHPGGRKLPKVDSQAQERQTDPPEESISNPTTPRPCSAIRPISNASSIYRRSSALTEHQRRHAVTDPIGVTGEYDYEVVSDRRPVVPSLTSHRRASRTRHAFLAMPPGLKAQAQGNRRADRCGHQSPTGPTACIDPGPAAGSVSPRIRPVHLHAADGVD